MENNRDVISMVAQEFDPRRDQDQWPELEEMIRQNNVIGELFSLEVGVLKHTTRGAIMGLFILSVTESNNKEIFAAIMIADIVQYAIRTARNAFRTFF